MKYRSVKYSSLLLSILMVLVSCREPVKRGKLFIIGGGRISAEMINKMADESGIAHEGYGIILPMSSEEPDSAIAEHRPQFTSEGFTNVYPLQFRKGESCPPEKIDSIRNARLIFISGGDQSRFMDIIAGTPVKEALHDAYAKGAVIGGTSAGASLQSERMVTGNELKYPDNTGTFNSMEADNVEMIEGLGLLKYIIIDQHFLKRKRLNRLISMVIEHPGLTGIGIDESTAIYVDGSNATVYGESQVVVVQHPSGKFKVDNGKLGAKKLQLDVYLPGETFKIKNPK